MRTRSGDTFVRANCYDKNGNMTSRGGSAISWYSYNQPNQVNAGTNSTQFNYNANRQRWKQVAVDGTGTTTTWYIGGIMEKFNRPGGVNEYRHMIPAGSGMVIYMRKPDATNSTTYVTSLTFCTSLVTFPAIFASR